MAQRIPNGLERDGRGQKLWKSLTSRVEFREDELRVLENACFTADRIKKLRRAIGEHFTVTGSTGQLVAHPLLQQLRADEAHEANLLKQLNIPEEESSVGKNDSRSAKMRDTANIRWQKSFSATG